MTLDEIKNLIERVEDADVSYEGYTLVACADLRELVRLAKLGLEVESVQPRHPLDAFAREVDVAGTPAVSVWSSAEIRKAARGGTPLVLPPEIDRMRRAGFRGEFGTTDLRPDTNGRVLVPVRWIPVTPAALNIASALHGLRVFCSPYAAIWAGR